MAIGGLTFVVQVRTARHYTVAMTQILNEPLAERLATEYFDSVSSTGDDVAEWKVQFSRIMAINPNIELYLLDRDGRIKAFTAPADEVRRDRIDPRPVHDFLSGRFVIPTFGDDPKDPEQRKIFSVSLLKHGHPEAGFLYVILGGTDYDLAARKVQNSQLFRNVFLVIVSCVSISLIAAFFVATTMTRRLRRLATAVDRFRADQFRALTPVPTSDGANGDELDRLAGSFNLMAMHIHAQMQEIAESNALRRDLIAGVSHDLRTPLASLRGYLETLIMKDEALSPQERRTYLDIAFRQSQRTARLVEELFELARLEELEVRIQREPFQLSELVQDVLLKFKLIAEERTIRLMGRFMPGAPLFSGDIALMERLLDNLLENAIRHTPDGGQVEVAVTVDGSRLRLEVSDTGSGIPATDVPRVFERSYRGDETVRLNTSGRGLGLAIAKRIVELHEGRIGIRSEVGVGTRVFIELPIHAVN